MLENGSTTLCTAKVNCTNRVVVGYRRFFIIPKKKHTRLSLVIADSSVETHIHIVCIIIPPADK